MGASSDILYPPTKQEEAAAHIIAGGMYYFINLVSHLFQLNTASKSGYFLFIFIVQVCIFPTGLVTLQPRYISFHGK